MGQVDVTFGDLDFLRAMLFYGMIFLSNGGASD
jgi:hypothetical protein